MISNAKYKCFTGALVRWSAFPFVAHVLQNIMRYVSAQAQNVEQLTESELGCLSVQVQIRLTWLSQLAA